MKLSDFLNYDNIWIQCHDNPDGDALASGYGVYYYLKKMGKNPKLVYAGRFQIQKSNLKLMVEELNIPIEYLSMADLECLTDIPDLLITVDCQYGEGNVTKIEAKKIAIIDHHQIGKGKDVEESRIVPNLGACATLVYQMLEEEGININDDELLTTALYYGLLTDTNNFAELCHPLDRNLQDDAHFRASMIRKFRNANISLEEIEIAGDALMHYYFDEKYKYAIVEAKPCDPNVLGIISDMILEVDVVNTCLVYSLQEFGTKLSIRSCVREVLANELASFLTEGNGNGGGHLDKAGGFISLVGQEAVDTLHARLLAYFEDTEIIDVDTYQADITGCDRYMKIPFKMGFVKGLDVAEENQQVVVRALEGDQQISIEKNTFIMIGLTGEIYPITEEKFAKNYELLHESYNPDFHYQPELIDSKNGMRIGLIPHAKPCMAMGRVSIYVKPLDHRVKVFTAWDKDRYYLGKPGDVLAIREDDIKDVYIISREIFEKTYRKIEE